MCDIEILLDERDIKDIVKVGCRTTASRIKP